jgi:hypothetical protein
MKMVQKIPGKHEIKELQKKQPYWALNTHTSEKTTVKVQNIQHGK